MSQPESMKSGAGDNGFGSEFGVKIGDAVETSDVGNSSWRAAGDANFGVESSGNVMNTVGSSRVAVNNGSEYQAADNANADTVAGAGGSGVGYKAAGGGQKSDYEGRVRDGVFSNKDFGIGEDEKKSVFAGAVREQRNNKEVQKSLGEYKRELAKSGLSREEKEVRYRGTEEYYLGRRVEKKVKLLKSKKELINKLQSEIGGIEDTTEKEDYLAGLDMTEYVRKNLKSGEFTDAELGEVVRGVREVVEGEVKDKYSYDEKKRAVALAGRDGYQVRADEFRAETDLSTADKMSIAERNPGEWEENSELAEELYTKVMGGRFNEILAAEGLSEEEKHARMRALNEGAYQEAYKVAGWYTELVKSLEERYPDTRSIAGLSNQELREYMAESLEENNISLSRQEAEMLREKLLLHFDERFPMSAAGRQREEAGKPSDLAEEQEERDKIFAENPAVVKLREDVMTNIIDNIGDIKKLAQMSDKELFALAEKFSKGYGRSEGLRKQAYELAYEYLKNNAVLITQENEKKGDIEDDRNYKEVMKHVFSDVDLTTVEISTEEGEMLEKSGYGGDWENFTEDSPAARKIIDSHYKSFIAPIQEYYDSLSESQKNNIYQLFLSRSKIERRMKYWINPKYKKALYGEMEQVEYSVDDAKAKLSKDNPEKFNEDMTLDELIKYPEYIEEINNLNNITTDLTDEKIRKIVEKSDVPRALWPKYIEDLKKRREIAKNEFVIKNLIDCRMKIYEMNERIKQEHPYDWDKYLIPSPFPNRVVSGISNIFMDAGLYDGGGDSKGKARTRMLLAQEICDRLIVKKQIEMGDAIPVLSSMAEKVRGSLGEMSVLSDWEVAKKDLTYIMQGANIDDVRDILTEEAEAEACLNLFMSLSMGGLIKKPLGFMGKEWIADNGTLTMDVLRLISGNVLPLTVQDAAANVAVSEMSDIIVNLKSGEEFLESQKKRKSIYEQDGLESK